MGLVAEQLSDTQAEAILDKHGKPYIYPWNKWLNGSWWLLKEGKDYHSSTKGFRQRIYRKQNKWGRIRTRVIGKTILIKRDGAYGNNRRVK